MPFKALSGIILVCKTFGFQMHYAQITIYTHLNSCMQFDTKTEDEIFCYSYTLYVHIFIWIQVSCLNIFVGNVCPKNDNAHREGSLTK